MEKIVLTQEKIEERIAQNESETFRYSYRERGEYRLVVKGVNEVSEFETTPILMDVSSFSYVLFPLLRITQCKYLHTVKSPTLLIATLCALFFPCEKFFPVT